MHKKLFSFKIKIILSLLLSFSVVFFSIGYYSLEKEDYKLSDYFNQLNVDKDIFKSTINSISNYFEFKLDFSLNDYSSSNFYDLSNNISELNFNFTSQDIEIYNYPNEKLSIEIDSDYSNDIELSYNKTDNTLFFNTKYNTPSKAKIIIKIPDNINSKAAINLSTSSGKVTVSDFQSHSLKITTASGNLNLSNCITSYLYLTSSSGSIALNNINNTIESKFTSNSGKIKANGYFGSLISNNSTGNTDLEFTTLGKYNNINSKLGSIKLYMPKNSNGYKINFSTSSGSYRSSADLLSLGDESSQFNIQTVTGNLYIFK